MIVVTGAPRSGTSLMMRLLGDALGWDRVMGEAHPPHDEAWSAGLRRRFPNISDEQVARMDRMDRDFNPDGYYETRWVFSGLSGDEPVGDPGKTIKIVGAGLGKTHPRHVDRLIVMVRHPYECAESRARISRAIFHQHAHLIEPDPKDYAEQYGQIAAFIERHQTPYTIVSLEHLRRDPVPVLSVLGTLLGASFDPSIVKPDRSVAINYVPCGPWCSCAERCWRNLLWVNPDFRAITQDIERTRNAEAIRSLTPEERRMVGIA